MLPKAYRDTCDPGRAIACKRMIAVLVIFFIIGAIFSRPDIVEPLLVTAVPLNRLAQAVVQGDLRLPAQLRLNFIASQCIPAIMSRTILNVRNQRFGFSS